MALAHEALRTQERLPNINYISPAYGRPFDGILELGREFESRNLGVRVVKRTSEHTLAPFHVYAETYQDKLRFDGFLFTNPEMKALYVPGGWPAPTFEGIKDWDEQTKAKVTALYWMRRASNLDAVKKPSVMVDYARRAEEALQAHSEIVVKWGRIFPKFETATLSPLTETEFRKLIHSAVVKSLELQK